MAGPAAGQTQPPEAPHVWSVDSLTEAVRVHWWAVTGADSYDVRWKGPGQPYDDNRMTEGIEAPEGVEPHYFYVIRELTNGTLYTVQVRASNSAGNSGWSNERTRRPTMPPDAPVLRATPGDRSIAITWDAVARRVLLPARLDPGRPRRIGFHKRLVDVPYHREPGAGCVQADRLDEERRG